MLGTMRVLIAAAWLSACASASPVPTGTRLAASEMPPPTWPKCETRREVAPSPYACDADGLEGCLTAARARAAAETPEALHAACHADDAIACLAMAVSRSDDTSQAIGYVMQACAGNVDAACAVLAGFARLGEIEIDEPVRFVAPACRVGGAWMACGYGGWLLAEEQPGNPDQARIVLENACHCGDAGGCRGLASMIAYGQAGFDRDVPRALRLLREGCDAGYVRSCADIASLHVRGLVEPPDYVEARRFAERACELEERRACANLGALHLAGLGGPRDVETGVALTGRACELGLGESCNSLGGLYEQGVGVPVDPVRARELYQAACSADSAHGCLNLARAAEAGLGGPADPELMVRVVQRACDLGERIACEIIETARQESTPAP